MKMRRYSNGHMTFNDYFMMYLAKWKRVAVLLLVVWIVVTYLVISPLRCNGGSDEAAEFQVRLKRVSSQLETLRQQHSNLITQIKRSAGLNGLKDIEGLFLDDQGPSEEYENLRRRIYSNTKELWYYVNHEMGKAAADDLKPDRIQTILNEVADRKRSLISDQEKLPELDGYQEWRRMEAANVSDLVQRRLYYLQNPPDCKDARKLICNLNKGCGFGCQLHHIVYCLIFAYATERTLILNSKGWRYNNKGWEYVFHPISDTCTNAYNDKVLQWPVSYDAKVVSLPFIDSISQKPKFLPLAVPKDLAHSACISAFARGQRVSCQRFRASLFSQISFLIHDGRDSRRSPDVVVCEDASRDDWMAAVTSSVARSRSSEVSIGCVVMRDSVSCSNRSQHIFRFRMGAATLLGVSLKVFYLFTMVVLTIVVASVLEAFRFRIQYKRSTTKRDEEKLLHEEVHTSWEEAQRLGASGDLADELRPFLPPGVEVTFIGSRPRTKEVLQRRMYQQDIQKWLSEEDENEGLPPSTTMTSSEDPLAPPLIAPGDGGDAAPARPHYQL